MLFNVSNQYYLHQLSLFFSPRGPFFERKSSRRLLSRASLVYFVSAEKNRGTFSSGNRPCFDASTPWISCCVRSTPLPYPHLLPCSVLPTYYSSWTTRECAISLPTCSGVPIIKSEFLYLRSHFVQLYKLALPRPGYCGGSGLNVFFARLSKLCTPHSL